MRQDAKAKAGAEAATADPVVEASAASAAAPAVALASVYCEAPKASSGFRHIEEHGAMNQVWHLSVSLSLSSLFCTSLSLP